MKDSKIYAKKIQKLYRDMKRRYGKVEKNTFEEPVEALVYAVISEKMTLNEAQDALKKINEYFIDINDLRVSRHEEIMEVLEGKNEKNKLLSYTLTTTLRAVFEKYNMLSLADLKKIGKRPAKEALSKISSITPFVIDYCMLTSLGGHAIPLNENTLQFLKEQQLVHPEADMQEIEGFLTRQISAKNAYEFYYLLRQQSEDSNSLEAKKTTTRKRAAKRKK